MDSRAADFLAFALLAAPFATFAIGYWLGYRHRDNLSWKRHNKQT